MCYSQDDGRIYLNIFIVYSGKWDPSFKFPDARQFILIPSVYLGQRLCNLIRHNFRRLPLRLFVKMRLGHGAWAPTDSTLPLWKEVCLDPSYLPAEPHLLWHSFPHTLVPLTHSSACCLLPSRCLHPARSSPEDGRVPSGLQVAAICSSELCGQHCANKRP